MLKVKWEHIDSGEEEFETWVATVPGGWLVRTWQYGGCDDAQTSTCVFVPGK